MRAVHGASAALTFPPPTSAAPEPACAAAAPGDASAGTPRSVADIRRFTAGMRAIVVTLCALVLASQGVTPGGMVWVLLGNVLWACSVLLVEMQGRPLGRPLLHLWIDVAWTLLLLRASPAGADVLVLTFILPVVMASISHGVRQGVLLGLFAAFGLVLDLGGDWRGGLPLGSRHLLPALGVLTLAPAAALVARPVGQLRRRLSVLQQISAELDPRRGCAALARGLTARLRQVTGAATVAMVLPRSRGEALAVISSAGGGEAHAPEACHAMLERLLQALPPVPLSYQPHRWSGLVGGVFMYAAAPAGPATAATLVELSAWLEAESLVVVPLRRFGLAHGHLVLGWARADHARWDAAALAQLAPDLGRLIEQADLVDELHDEIAAHERARIGRDMHDSAIQPYLGLKYAVEGLAQRLAPGHPLHAEVTLLADLVNQEVAALRDTISSLRGGPSGGDGALAPALRRQVRRFSALFGIRIHLSCPDDLPIRRSLAAALFHMVNESLNNVRKHTNARNAWVCVELAAHQISLKVADDAGSTAGQAVPGFVPRSLSERVGELGGTLAIGRRGGIDTELHFIIPQ